MYPDCHPDIESIYKQFLCGVSLPNFDWKDILEQPFNEEDHALQVQILECTVNSQLVLKYPVNYSYQYKFVKHFLAQLEKRNSIVSSDLYEAIGRLCVRTVTKEDTTCFKHYVIGYTGHIISLKEHLCFVSDGTTGLQTWEASLALSEWIIQNKAAFDNKAVLELGSGIGLTGLVIYKVCSPSRLYLSDCHSKVIESLNENIELNLLNNGSGDGRLSSKDSDLKNIKVLELLWEEINEAVCRRIGKIEIVVASDIIYDSSLFKSLIFAMTNLSKYSSVEEFIFACTVRNEKTLDLFLKLVGEHSFAITQLTTPPQKNFIWPTDAEIKLFSVKLNKIYI